MIYFLIKFAHSITRNLIFIFALSSVFVYSNLVFILAVSSVCDSASVFALESFHVCIEREGLNPSIMFNIIV